MLRSSCRARSVSRSRSFSTRPESRSDCPGEIALRTGKRNYSRTRTDARSARKGSASRRHSTTVLSVVLALWHSSAAPPSAAETNAPPPQTERELTVYELITRPRFHGPEQWRFEGFVPGARVAIGDFDCDGRSDLAQLVRGGHELIVGYSNGRDEFRTARYPIAGPEANPAIVAGLTTGDFDGDGCRNELAFTAPRERGGLSVLRVSNAEPLDPLKIETGLTANRIALFTLGWSSTHDSIVALDTSSTQRSREGRVLDLMGHYRGDPLISSQFEAASSMQDVGIADLRGNTAEAALVQRRDLPQSRMAATVPMFQWGAALLARLPRRDRWKGSVIGEFNGDGRDDLLTVSESLAGSMLIVSNGLVPFELTLPLQPKLIVEPLAGDFDGDGIDDLLAPMSSMLTVQRSEAPRAVSGATALLRAGDGTETPLGSTDQQGKLRISSPLPTDGALIVSSPGGVQVGRTVRRGARMHAALFFPARYPSGIGAQVRYDGTRPGRTVCTGYTARPKESHWGRMEGVCPEQSAIVEGDDGSIDVPALCCKLPRDDILTADVVQLPGRVCPTDYIATGTTGNRYQGEIPKIHCTKINLERYALEDPQPARYWGVGGSAPYGGSIVQRSQIIPAIRVGVGRVGYSDWDVDGCIAHDENGVFTTKSEARCSDARTARIFERIRSEHDGSESRAVVELFPRCTSIPDPYDPTKGCD